MTQPSSSEIFLMDDGALDQLPVGVLITSRDGLILKANDVFLAISGFGRAEVLGRTCRFFQGPATDPDTLDAMRKAQKDATEFSGEILNYRKDCTPFWNALTISPVFNHQGRLANFVGVIRDLTQSNQAGECSSDGAQSNQS